MNNSLAFKESLFELSLIYGIDKDILYRIVDKAIGKVYNTKHPPQ